MRNYNNNSINNVHSDINNRCFGDQGDTCSALNAKYCKKAGYHTCKFYKTKEQLNREIEKANEINLRKGISTEKYNTSYKR